MTDKRNGTVFIPLKFILYLLSLIYGLVIYVRALFYRFGVFKTHKVPMKVISVGNLTLGGTGKTPFVIALVKILKDEVKKDPSVLIRGYGWDEQAMLKKNLVYTPILVGENRVKAAHRAIKLYGSDTAIMDDGFQYWGLGRDLDIVLIDSRNPFGNGYLFPRGILRESRSAIKRAGIAVFTKIDKPLCDLDEIKKSLREIRPDIIFLEAMHSPRNLYDVKARKELDVRHIKGKRVILLSSIGDPEYFRQTAAGLGANVIDHIKFADHHNYTKSDIDDIAAACDERSFDILMTTEKDAVKLNRLGLFISNYAVMILLVEMNITNGKENLVARLHSLYNS